MREKRFRRLSMWAVVLIATLLGAPAAWGQAAQTGSLVGTVNDVNGDGLPGVLIEAHSPSLQGSRTTMSGINGDYILRGLPAGTYEVTLSLDGFATVEGSTRIDLGSPARIDATMQLTVVSETLEVVGEAPNALETTQISLNITNEDVDQLPIARTLDVIADLAPGLTLNTANNNQVTINGAFGYDNKWLVNGVEINDNVFGSFNNLFIEDAIAETQVLTSGISAEYGRFTGGVVNVITKSGGNELSGSLRMDLTNPSWRDETPFEEDNAVERQDTTNDVWQATLGGRILRDKLWFFTAGRTQELDETQTFAVTGAGYTQIDENDRFEVKLTANLNDSHSLTGSYIDNDSVFSDTPSLGITIDTNALQDVENVNDLLVFRYAGILTNSWFVEAQYSQKDYMSTRGGEPGDLATNSPFISFGLNLPQGVDQYNAPYFDRSDPEERNNEQLAASVSYFLTSERYGSHDLKVGVEQFTDQNVGGNSQSPTNQIFLVDYLQDAGGAPVYDSQGRIVPAFYSFCADFFDPSSCGDPALYGFSARNEWLPERRSVLDIETNSIYVNDVWQLNDNWSFNLGVRYEDADSVATGDITAVDTTRWVPRLAASYDVKGDGRYRLDATWAQYVGGNTINNASSNSNVGNPSLVQWAYIGPAGTGLDFEPAFDLDNWIPIFARFPKESVFITDMEAPIVDEMTLSFGMTLPKEKGFFKATYVNREVDDIVEDFVDITNGITTITDPIVVQADNIVFLNTGLARREYEAIQIGGVYRINNNWNISGNYTFQINNDGNFVGEATNQPVLSSDIGDQTEFYNGRNISYGRLPAFQEHKLRLWTSYHWNLGEAGNLIFGALVNYDSGTPYSIADGNAPVTAEQLALDPGYANPPTSQTIFFEERGSRLFDGFTTLDLAVSYDIPVWKTLAPWVKVEVFNVFNDDTAISYNTSVTGDFNGPLDEFGLPLDYVEGPRFGEPESRTDYVTPIEYRLSVGLRF